MSKMGAEFIRQREEDYVMGRCDDLHQEYLAEISFCELEARKKAILDCAEWVKALLRPGVIADLMIKDLLNKEQL